MTKSQDKINLAKRQIEEVIDKVVEKYTLSYGEIILILTKILHNWASGLTYRK